MFSKHLISFDIGLNLYTTDTLRQRQSPTYLWNSLPRCVRDITGKDVMFFKNKLDKVLAYYPDVPRCSDTCHSLDGNMRKSNSLCDHYRNEQTKVKVNGITKV